MLGMGVEKMEKVKTAAVTTQTAILERMAMVGMCQRHR